MEPEKIDQLKNIFLSSASGLGVLGGLIGVGKQFKATEIPQEEMMALADSLQQNSQDLASLASSLNSEDTAQATELSGYLNSVAKKLEQGELPAQEELQVANEKIEDLAKDNGIDLSSPETLTTPETDSEDNISEEGKQNSEVSNPVDDESSNSNTTSSKEDSDVGGSDNSGSSESIKETASSESPSSSGTSSGVSSSSGGTSSGVSSSSGGTSSSSNSDKKSENENNLAQGLTEQTEEIEEQIKGITEQLAEFNQVFDNFSEDSESEVESMNQTTEELDTMVDTLKDNFATKQEEFNTQEDQVNTQFEDFEKTVGDLTANVSKLNESSQENQGQIISKIQEEKSSLQDIANQVDDTTNNIVDNEAVESTDIEEVDFADSVSISLGLLNQIQEKTDNTFTPFNNLMNNMEQELEGGIISINSDLDKLTQNINNNQEDLLDKISNLSVFEEEKRTKINSQFNNLSNQLSQEITLFEDNTQNSLRELEEKNVSLLETMSDQFEDTFKNNLENQLGSLDNQLSQQLNDLKDNYHLITGVKIISKDVENLAENIIKAGEDIEEMTTELEIFSV